MLRKMYIDIESLEKGDPRKGNKPIDIITYWCNGCYHVFIWKPITAIPVYQGDPVVVHITDTEREMLEEFARNFIADDPDLILAWNVDYDLSYIISRMKRLGLEPAYLSPFGQAYISRREGAKIKGRLKGDLLEIYRDSRSAYSSNALSDVVWEEYGIEKDERYEKAKDNPTVLFELNLQHVWLHKKLDEDFGLSDFYLGIYHLTGYNPFEKYSATSFVDYYMLTVREEGEYLPMPQERKRKTYKAAIVLDPLVGLHHNVACIDFSRMYPSIMLAFNISPDTIVPYGEGDINYKTKDVEVGFRTDKLGIIPRAILIAFKIRDEIDKLIAEETDPLRLKALKGYKQAIKGLINSFYGVFAYPRFRLYDERIAITVVSVARELLLYTKQVAEEHGFTVCYGDTDSIFIKNGGNLQGMVDTTEEFASTITFEFLEKYGDVNWKRIKVDFEKLYSKILFIAKKRYAGYVVWEGDWLAEPYLDVTGLEYVRSDYPKFTKELQKAVLEKALHGASKKEIMDYVQKKWNELIEKGKLFDFALKDRITKPLSEYKVKSIHIKAALNSHKLFGMNFTVGDAVYYVYVKGGPRVVAVDRKMDSLPWKIDYEKHYELMVKNPIEPIIGNVTTYKGKVRGLEAWI